ncbi:MAG: hypothetical protein JW854_17615 [Actinobacteria bacterium]|nr:hypothetical protein [Actinomycetota bacterium]
MSANKSRIATLMALMGMTLILGLLAWRGFKAAPEGDNTAELVWRQAGEEDLF